MSRFPSVSAAGHATPASIFARLREHLARFPGDVIPLQIGDTHLAPAHALDAIRWDTLAPADVYAYGSPAGWDPLIEAIVAKARAKNGIELTAAGVQVTVGTTHALSCALQALCDPGDELLVVTPHWPLIKGMAIAQSVRAIEVAFDQVEAAITPRTTVVYVASPNNPDGEMLDAAQIAELVRIARAHDLWILSDEVYEDYVYDRPHVSVATRAPERTVTTFSFAKSYAQAGLRVGYALGPADVIATVKKLVNHSVYNVPVATQMAAYHALCTGDAFLAAARDRYRAARDRARARLHAPAALPPGGAYLWVDFSAFSGDDCMPVLEKIAAQGVLLAPGSAFGDSCTAHARLCFTGVDEARLDEGIDRINGVLASWPSIG
ncbi:MAG TPA: pyridoxal phosphate-dependent aminotransferase [Kofleriaceae bacterium]|nr:pyridoxal phosphate-dependent aminotransferase [Kofleriaceae bacterium]